MSTHEIRRLAPDAGAALAHAALTAGLLLAGVVAVWLAVLSAVRGDVLETVVALLAVPALVRLQGDVSARLLHARGGWWPVPFAAVVACGAVVLAVAALR